MTYPYGGPGQYPPRSSTPRGAYSPKSTSAANREPPPRTYLGWAVLVLGLATYVVSYGPMVEPGGAGWEVRFSTLAAVVAAVGLLPRQSAHAKLMAALAVVGFLEALSRWITASDALNPRWPIIVIVVLNGLQALTAIAALLSEIGLLSAPDRGPATYDPYAYYAQADQQYYGARNQQRQPQVVQASGTAHAEAAVPAQPQQSAAERYPQYAEYLTAPQSRPAPQRPASPQAAGSTRADQPASGAGLPGTGQTASTPQRPDTPREFPTQSSSS